MASPLDGYKIHGARANDTGYIVKHPSNKEYQLFHDDYNSFPEEYPQPEGEYILKDGETMEDRKRGAAQWDKGATVEEMLLPTISIVLFIFMFLLMLSCLTQIRWWKKKMPFFKTESPFQMSFPARQRATPLLSSEEEDVIETYSSYFNQPLYLFLISIPALISMAVCPLGLFLYGPFVDQFWPKALFPINPQITDVIACFLMPAGLVYAIAFGFGFNEAQIKQKMMLDGVSSRRALMSRVISLTFVVEELTVKQKQDIYKMLKNEMIDWMKMLMGHKKKDNNDCLHGNLFHAIHYVSKIMKKCGRTTLLSHLYEAMLNLDGLMSTSSQQQHMPIVQWMFLLVLGFFAFFGILLLRAESYRLELCMCTLTVMSMSAFCYILADLDSPSHGAFRIPTERLVPIIYNLEFAHEELGDSDTNIPKPKSPTLSPSVNPNFSSNANNIVDPWDNMEMARPVSLARTPVKEKPA